MSLDVQVLRESFAVAKGISDQVADKFYEFLFSDYPEVRPMFKDTKMEGQKKALMKGLSYIVDHLEDGDRLSEYLRQMGKRHVDYGTAPAHYEAVGNTLIKTFAHFFENKWTEELQDEWIKAYGVITDLMLEGAAYAEPDEQTIKKRAAIHANNILLNTLDEELENPELQDRIRQKVRRMIFEVLDDEYEKVLRSKKAA